jgi:hypothetical protein
MSESGQVEERLEPSEETVEPPEEKREETTPDIGFEEMLKVFAYDHNLSMKEEDIQRQRKVHLLVIQNCHCVGYRSAYWR